MINKSLILSRAMLTTIVNRNVMGISNPSTQLMNQLKNFQPGISQSSSQYSAQLAALQSLLQTVSKESRGGKIG